MTSPDQITQALFMIGEKIDNHCHIIDIFLAIDIAIAIFILAMIISSLLIKKSEQNNRSFNRFKGRKRRNFQNRKKQILKNNKKKESNHLSKIDIAKLYRTGECEDDIKKIEPLHKDELIEDCESDDESMGDQISNLVKELKEGPPSSLDTEEEEEMIIEGYIDEE